MITSNRISSLSLFWMLLLLLLVSPAMSSLWRTPRAVVASSSRRSLSAFVIDNNHYHHHKRCLPEWWYYGHDDSCGANGSAGSTTTTATATTPTRNIPWTRRKTSRQLLYKNSRYDGDAHLYSTGRQGNLPVFYSFSSLSEKQKKQRTSGCSSSSSYCASHSRNYNQHHASNIINPTTATTTTTALLLQQSPAEDSGESMGEVVESTSIITATTTDSKTILQERIQQRQQDSNAVITTTPTSILVPSTEGCKSVSTIYSNPKVYDLAFSYRDYEEEVDFLLNCHNLYKLVQQEEGEENNKLLLQQEQDGIQILEVAAGPARHSIEALQQNQYRVHSVTCIDTSIHMQQYATQLAQEELYQDDINSDNDVDVDRRRQQFRYELADMTNFQLTADHASNHEEQSFSSTSLLVDTVWVLLGSLQHLVHGTESVISCFQSMKNAVRPGGTIILELPHPQELFGLVECTQDGWTIPLSNDDIRQLLQQQLILPPSTLDDNKKDSDNENDSTTSSTAAANELRIVWGNENDSFDPIQQIRNMTVSMEFHGVAAAADSTMMKGLENIKEIVPMRLFTVQEINILAHCTGLEVVTMYGAMDNAVPIMDCDDTNADEDTNDDEAYRLVMVLRRPL